MFPRNCGRYGSRTVPSGAARPSATDRSCKANT